MTSPSTSVRNGRISLTDIRLRGYSIAAAMTFAARTRPSQDARAAPSPSPQPAE